MPKANLEVRRLMQEHEIYQWQLAKELGCCETTMCRMLREEMVPDDKRRILGIIESMIRKRDSLREEG